MATAGTEAVITAVVIMTSRADGTEENAPHGAYN